MKLNLPVTLTIICLMLLSLLLVVRFSAPTRTPTAKPFSTQESMRPAEKYISDELARYDYKRWQAWQERQCKKANESLVSIGIVGVAMYPACASSVTGFGLVACAFTVVSYASLLHDQAKKQKNCRANYPGVSQWGP